MITEEQYQDVIKPFVNEDAYYPSTLQEYLLFSKVEFDPDKTDFENMLGIVKLLLQINYFFCPKESELIHQDVLAQIDPRK